MPNHLHHAGVTGLSQHTGRLIAGDAFCAFPGEKTDGRNFIEDAIKKGAKALIVDPLNLTPEQSVMIEDAEVPLFLVDNLADKLPAMADEFYRHPSRHMHVIAVTGTNGKSSIAHGLNQMYLALDVPVAMIGTLGIGTLDHLIDNPLTTPDACSLTRYLADMYANEIETVVMEASSHALDQGRLKATEIRVAIFTNLTQDHLDYHHTLDAYGKAKAILYQMPSVETVVINLDDEWCRSQIPLIPTYKKVIGYTCMNATHPRCDSVISAVREGDHYRVCEGSVCATLTPVLIGDFNLSNLLAMIGAMRVDGFALNVLTTVASRVKEIPGRLECVSEAGDPRVIIDFAHTPDALLKALDALRPTTRGKLWCVFGCGGDRDVTKRPIMGGIAAHHADHVVITSDNPRNENPQTIADMVVSGFPKGLTPTVILEREKAIEHAIEHASIEDTILVAGKGHEKSQIIGSLVVPFSDQGIARQALDKRRHPA